MTNLAARLEQGGCTLENVLAERLSETPDKVFLWLDDRPFTFQDVEESVRSAANQLLSLGVGPGDTVALYATNSLEWVSMWLAAPRIGALSAPVNVMFRGELLARQLQDTRSKVLLVDRPFLPAVAEVFPQVKDLETVLVVGGPDPDAAALDGGGPQVVDAGLLAQGDRLAVRPGAEPLAWNEPACVFYTSGTTGPSKGALLSQHYLCVAAETLATTHGLVSDDVVFGALPLFHLGGALSTVVSGIVSGRTTVLDRMFSVSQCWDRARRYEATVFLGVGPMVAMLASQPPDAADADLPVRIIVASPVPAALQGAVETRFNCAVAQMYGQTEVIPVAMTDMRAGRVPGSAGPVGPLHDVRIVDDEDRDVAPGQVGEVVVRPRYAHVMFEGYLNAPEATLGQMRNMWFHTGDLARIDPEGMLWWVDRKKDAIRRRGENISSYEVEQILMRHPAVMECAVHGAPSPVGEEDVKACVVLVPEQPAEPGVLHEFCVGEMASFMVPRYIEVLASLPKNAVGRVQKHVLRRQPITPETWDSTTGACCGTDGSPGIIR